MEIENFEQKKQILSNLLIDGFDNANYSHKLLFVKNLTTYYISSLNLIQNS